MKKNKTGDILTSYCKFARSEKADPVHKKHHEVYGYPLEDDDALFQRLCLEINQAGLSWETILKKEDALNNAYRLFSIEKVSRFAEKDISRLLSDKGIIRNERKIRAIIKNAQIIRNIQKAHGSLKNWLDKNSFLSKEEWVRLFKKTFLFTGPEIVNEFLISTGYLPGAHDKDCPHYKRVLKKVPAWAVK